MTLILFLSEGCDKVHFHLIYQISNVLRIPFSFIGSINRQETSKRDRYTMEVHTSSSYLVSSLQGFVNVPKDGNGGSSRVEIDYRLGETGRDERMVVSSKWRDADARLEREVTVTG